MNSESKKSPPRRSGRRRGGLEPDRPLSSADLDSLGAEIDQAVEHSTVRNARKEYLASRGRSIPNRLRVNHLPLAEAADPRFHECRASGWSPSVVAIREWFFGLSDDNRRELVNIAIRSHVPYAQAALDGKQTEYRLPRKRMVKEVDDDR